ADAEGNLWFGTMDGGLIRLDSERFTSFPENDQLGKRVYAITEALNGNLICGTSLGGTTVFDGKEYHHANAGEGFTSSIVQTFYYTPDGTLWIGTQDDGAFRYARDGFDHYTVRDGLPSNNITGFVMDGRQQMWIASADSGVAVIQIKGDSLLIVARYDVESGLASNRVNAIALDASQQVWIGTEDNGLSKITTPKDSTQEAIIRNLAIGTASEKEAVHSIRTDADHAYIGTSAGIFVWRGEKFVAISKKDGLASAEVYSIAVTRSGIWAGTERGISRVSYSDDFQQINVTNFGPEEGFRGGEVYRNASCVDRNGNVWFGTTAGLVKFDPRKELSPETTPRIHLQQIRLFFDDIANSQYVDTVARWSGLPPSVTLPHDQNTLTFSFTGTLHRNPKAVRYRWMLEGVNADWSPPAHVREVTFSDLSPGYYTFKVIAGNEFGVWSPSPATFSFRIEAPLWQRWWFQTAAGFLILATLWMAYTVRIRSIRRKNKIIHEKLELENTLLKLEHEAARLQMNPHFIFNCLNSIQGFISAADTVAAKKYLAKFARLMRLILENSRQEFIPLSTEIQLLENYMELEKLAASQPFQYRVDLKRYVEPEEILIPPMIIQPFVENAIVHGLRKMQRPGEITVAFHVDQEVLHCEVIDTGVGRKKSAELKAGQVGEHRSSGILVTTKRLEQYGKQRGVSAGIQIMDLENDGTPAGTRVIISIPCHRAGGPEETEGFDRRSDTGV
ncbi:MAG TPA: two-component regulator propeller domain-containing protein, partial [Chryseosolibacter sp.]|nr:two-component regulator propeller domain-containing protein [Chryseosolibacter sp.]